MRHLDLFSGIGGFSLAAQWVWGAEHEIVAFCEIDKFCQKVLKKHWPDVLIIEDIHDIKGDGFGTVDIITAGYPCQGESKAGKRRGEADDRWLWPDTFQQIQRFSPTWFLGENVDGHVSLGLDQVLSDLENEGYSWRAFVIPACSVGAGHRRDRVWIVANSNSERLEKCRHFKGESAKKTETQNENKSTGGFANLANCDILPDAGNWPRESMFLRKTHGISNRVDRIKALGNAIVPQVAAVIMQAIKEVDEQCQK